MCQKQNVENRLKSSRKILESMSILNPKIILLLILIIYSIFSLVIIRSNRLKKISNEQKNFLDEEVDDNEDQNRIKVR